MGKNRGDSMNKGLVGEVDGWIMGFGGRRDIGGDG